MLQVYKIDSKGYFIESAIINEKDITDLCITKKITTGFVKPLWKNNEWVEGATKNEILVYNEQIENLKTDIIEENLIDKLILDNINMQTQIDSLIQASLGGN